MKAKLIQAHLWYDMYTSKTYAGHQEITVDTPLSKIPIFISGGWWKNGCIFNSLAGSIIPKKERQRRSTTPMDCDPYTLQIVLDKNGSASGEIYADDGHTMAFANGEYLWRSLKYDTSGKSAVLQSSKLGNSTVSNNAGCWKDAQVEKIVIWGASGTPKSVSVSYSSNTNNAPVEWSQENQALVLRKPVKAAISEDWKLSIVW